MVLIAFIFLIWGTNEFSTENGKATNGGKYDLEKNHMLG